MEKTFLPSHLLSFGEMWGRDLYIITTHFCVISHKYHDPCVNPLGERDVFHSYFLFQGQSFNDQPKPNFKAPNYNIYWFKD